MAIARIENNAVVEYRDMEMQDVPEHKRHIWRPVVYEGAGGKQTVTIESNRVLIQRFDPPPTTPQVISDRQFFQLLAQRQVISGEEALAAVGPGDIPAAMGAIIDGMPADQRFPARMLLTGATQFDRQHPLVAAFAAAFGWSAADVDAFWSSASAL